MTNTYIVKYDKKTKGEGTILVKASSEADALNNARFLCFTGKNFRDAVITNEPYSLPRKQGFFGSRRQ